MKVGVLTFHDVANYGATLQAYSLIHLLKAEGYKAELIDYTPERITHLRRKHLYANPYFCFNAIKQQKMRNFLHKHIKSISKPCRTARELKQCTQSFDAVICGSDEIWNIYSPYQNFDLNYFLEFIDEKVRKISYGASFGQTTDLGEFGPQVGELLGCFWAISVRDQNSLQLVQPYRSSVTKVLDPTFLYHYSAIVSTPIVRKPYLLVYGGLSSEEQICVKEIATYHGLDLVSVGYPCRIANANHLTVSPSEWLGYFANASYIISDFYHGAIFSIIFKKPFSVFLRDSKANKIGDLLQDLRAEDRMILPQTLFHLQQGKLPASLNLDYCRLKQMIQDSKQFLFGALSLATNFKENSSV